MNQHDPGDECRCSQCEPVAIEIRAYSAWLEAQEMGGDRWDWDVVLRANRYIPELTTTIGDLRRQLEEAQALIELHRVVLRKIDIDPEEEYSGKDQWCLFCEGWPFHLPGCELAALLHGDTL